MAEKARDPKVSPANAGFTGYTEIQGIGGLPCADNFYETLLAMASHDLRQLLQLIISAQELLARRVAAVERPDDEPDKECRNDKYSAYQKEFLTVMLLLIGYLWGQE